MLEFSHLNFSYPSQQVLTNTSFHIHEGEFVALVGPNGAGKSTILKLLLGLEKADSGNIIVFGTSVSEGKKNIGYVPQYAQYDSAFPISVFQVVSMGRITPWLPLYSKKDKEKITEGTRTHECRTPQRSTLLCPFRGTKAQSPCCKGSCI